MIYFDKLMRPFYVLFNSLKWGTNDPVYHQKFVVLKFFGIGSITRIAHVIDTIGIDPKHITFVTFQSNRAVIDLLNLKAIYVNTKNPITLFITLFQVIFQLWKKKEATIIDMERTSNLSGIFRLLVGIGKPCHSFYFQTENKYKKGQLYVSLADKPAVKAIAEMFHKTYQENSKETYLASGSNKIFVNINAGNYCIERKFPLSAYSSLIKKLSEENPDWQFHLTGVPSEISFVSSFQEKLIASGVSPKSIINIAGKYNLSAFIKALKDARFFITNDSGPLHLSYYFDVKTVGIWGPTSPRLIGYKNSNRMLNLVSDLACSPCFIHPKSSVAKSCKGELTCFQSMKIEKMASDITQFVSSQKLEVSAV